MTAAFTSPLYEREPKLWARLGSPERPSWKTRFVFLRERGNTFSVQATRSMASLFPVPERNADGIFQAQVLTPPLPAPAGRAGERPGLTVSDEGCSGRCRVPDRVNLFRGLLRVPARFHLPAPREPRDALSRQAQATPERRALIRRGRGRARAASHGAAAGVPFRERLLQ